MAHRVFVDLPVESLERSVELFGPTFGVRCTDGEPP